MPQHGAPVAAQTLQSPVGGDGDGGDGDGGDGAGGSPPPLPGHDAHQHTFPPFPQLSAEPAVEQLPPAVEPSTQIVAGRGAFLVQIYMSTISTGAGVGTGVGGFVGTGVGGEVGGTGAGVGFKVGGFVGTGVGGVVGSAVGFGVGGTVGTGVGGFVGTDVGSGVGGFVGATGAGVGFGEGGFVGTGVGGLTGAGLGGGEGGLTGAGVGGGVVATAPLSVTYVNTPFQVPCPFPPNPYTLYHPLKTCKLVSSLARVFTPGLPPVQSALPPSLCTT